MMLGGVGLGFATANHYYRWVELSYDPLETWTDAFVVNVPAGSTTYEETTLPAPPKAAPKAETLPEPAPVLPSEATPEVDPGSEAPTDGETEETPPPPPAPNVEALPWDITHPATMEVGAHEQVRMAIDARKDAGVDDVLGSRGHSVGGATRAEVYAAQLIGGSCFKVEPSGRLRVAFSDEAPLLWTWTVNADKVGEDCQLEIYLGAVRNDAFVPLRLASMPLPVTPAQRPVFRDLWGWAGPIDDVLSILAGVITLLGATMAGLGFARPS